MTPEEMAAKYKPGLVLQDDHGDLWWIMSNNDKTENFPHGFLSLTILSLHMPGSYHFRIYRDDLIEYEGNYRLL